MDVQTPKSKTHATLAEVPKPARPSVPAIIVGAVIAVIASLSIWYLVRPVPLLVQGEVDATRLDIAARVDGRVAEIPVERSQNVAAGAVLVKIDNPETIAKHAQSVAARAVAEAQLANIRVGTRAEVIAARKAAVERAQANVVLAQKTFERIRQLAEHDNAPQARLDQATDSLHESHARSIRRSPPTSRRSTATRARNVRLPKQTSSRRQPTSKPSNPSSIK